jgi:16S rRNA pseudouridine516 synthase
VSLARRVIDLLDHPDRHRLHIVGRLDLNSSGLLLLTNDGRWSRQLTEPQNKVAKVYRVTLANPIRPEQISDYVEAFTQGMYFPFENITTRPAGLNVLSEYVAEVTLEEGRYHQIKRMFGRFRNPVVGLHRLAIGSVILDDALMPGESRELTVEEARIGGVG